MDWLILFLAGLAEIGWAVGLKQSLGFTRPAIAAGTVTLMVASFVLLGQALRTLPLGTAYAIWTGIGAVGTAIVGLVWLGESRDPLRLCCLGLILAGIIGLKLATPQ